MTYDSFVTAAIAVQEVVQEWTPRIQNAQNEQQANELRMQAQGEFEQAIQQTGGMTVEEYQQIGRAALQDPELNARIQELYRARIGK